MASLLVFPILIAVLWLVHAHFRVFTRRLYRITFVLLMIGLPIVAIVLLLLAIAHPPANPSLRGIAILGDGSGSMMIFAAEAVALWLIAILLELVLILVRHLRNQARTAQKECI